MIGQFLNAGDMVNRGTVNLGFTVYSYDIATAHPKKLGNYELGFDLLRYNDSDLANKN